jgi:DNA-binding response OmpR family regulator
VGLFDQLKSILGKTPSPSSPAQSHQDLAATNDNPPERRVRERHDARPGTSALIVDDSPTIVAALRKMLNSAGYVTLEALTAEEGIEIARDLTPDIIFLDIVLPGMNGFAALRTLRRDPLTRDIPVIMISGNEQATEQFFGTRIGADDFMKKPFSRLEVFARIERLLDPDMVPRRVNASTAEPSQEASAQG